MAFVINNTILYKIFITGHQYLYYLIYTSIGLQEDRYHIGFWGFIDL